MTRKPFITGSYAYGTPTDKSDIDLVIPPVETDNEIALLKANGDIGGDVIKYGKLNLIIAPTDEAFDLWHKCTLALVQLSITTPISREYAIKYIEKSFQDEGIDRFLYNSGE